MPTKLILLAAALLFTFPWSARAAPPETAPTIGLVIDDGLGKSIKGWQYELGALFTRYESRNQITTGKNDCCVVVFRKSNSYIVARTQALSYAPNGGVIKERIIATMRLDVRPGEEQTSCDLFGLDIGLSLRHAKTRWVRSVVVDRQGKLALLEWKDNANSCYLGD